MENPAKVWIEIKNGVVQDWQSEIAIELQIADRDSQEVDTYDVAPSDVPEWEGPNETD